MARARPLQNVFFRESFIDEMALAAGQDPIKFPPLAAGAPCRLPAGARCPWSPRVTGASLCRAGKGRGMAIHESYDSIVGMVAEVAVSNGEVQSRTRGDRLRLRCRGQPTI